MSVEAWKSLFDLSAVVLLFLTFAAGAGVLVTGNTINKRQEEKLRQFDSDMTKAKSDLARQQERAAKAEASIALAESHAADANTKAEGFRLDIAKANESSAQAQLHVAGATAEAAKATERAAEATKAAETEKIERLKLEAQVQPRQYTAEEEDAIVKACSGFAGHEVVIRSLPYDVEGAVFATSLAELLIKRTRLAVNASAIGDNFMQNLPMLIDVHVAGPPSERLLMNALTQALATPRVTVASVGSAPRLTIIVGGKRLAPRGIVQ